jgi:hypothetical protein
MKNKGLTTAQKKLILKDFKEYSGGFHPSEAGDEVDKYIDHQLWRAVVKGCDAAAQEYIENLQDGTDMINPIID